MRVTFSVLRHQWSKTNLISSTLFRTSQRGKQLRLTLQFFRMHYKIMPRFSMSVTRTTGMSRAMQLCRGNKKRFSFPRTLPRRIVANSKVRHLIMISFVKTILLRQKVCVETFKSFAVVCPFSAWRFNFHREQKLFSPPRGAFAPRT